MKSPYGEIRNLYVDPNALPPENPKRKEFGEQSMSRVGHCIDNGPTEGFWGILKTEMYYLNHFTDEDALRKAIAQYIDLYNNVRMQERFGSRTPEQVCREALEADIAALYPITPTSVLKSTSPSMMLKNNCHPYGQQLSTNILFIPLVYLTGGGSQ